MKKSAQKGVVSPILIAVGGIILVIVAISVASGAIKFEGSISKTGDKPSTSSETTSKQPDQPKEESTTSTKTYQNESNRFSLNYPANWSLNENPSSGVIVAFGSPKESSDDQFVDNINVTISNLSSRPGMSLEQLSDAWVKDVETAPGFSLQEKRSATLSGMDAAQLVYSVKSDKGQDLTGMVTMTIIDEKAFFVTYTAETASFDKFLDAANTAVASLKVD